MRHGTRVGYVIGLLTVCSFAFAGNSNPRSVSILDVGTKAPALSIDVWLKGDTIASFAPGHVYLVEFWGTWCAPCIQSIPHLNKLQHKHSDKPFTVLGVASHEFNGLDPVRAFLAEKGEKMNYAIGYDEDLSMEKTWQTGGQKDVIFRMPEAFVVDGTGTIIWKGHPADSTGMDTAIEKSLAASAQKQLESMQSK